jgi:YHS domain-containing protein
MNGYCPVELIKNDRWLKGDSRWSEVYQGVTYLFSNPVQRECFRVDPERYVPAYAGHDAVLMLEEHRNVPGQLENSVSCDGRLYMFSNSATLARFRQDPQRYAMPTARQ